MLYKLFGTPQSYGNLPLVQGKELIMEIDDAELRLLDPDSAATLHAQPLQQIRVWGVGQDNGR